MASVTSPCTFWRLRSSISGPRVVPVSVPWPRFIRSMRAASRRANSSATEFMHEEAVGRGAGLAHVAQLGEHRAVRGGVQVDVAEDEERRVAPEFHRGAQ